MRHVRCQHREAVKHGLLEGDAVRFLHAAPWHAGAPTGERVPSSEVRLLSPCEPTKILAVARNFSSHLQGRAAPVKPELVLKPPSAVIGDGNSIPRPAGASELHYEGELAVVIGRQVRSLAPDAWREAVLGYTCANDVTERTWQHDDLQWWRAKGCDGFAPLGPWIETDFDPALGRSITRLNGRIVQDGAFRDWTFGIGELLAFASRHMTLLPGDVVLMGTPGGTTAMAPGDRVEVEIPGIGILANPVD